MREPWHPETPRLRLIPTLVTVAVAALAIVLAIWILPGAHLSGIFSAVLTFAVIGLLNAVVPPVIAALRLPATVVVGFLACLAADVLVILLAAEVIAGFEVAGVGTALSMALLISAITLPLSVLLSTNDDDEWTFRVARRIARRQGQVEQTDVPGLLILEIDGLGLPILRRAMQDGGAPTLARWVLEGTHELTEWETDLSAQTGAAQAGILHGSNVDIPAFRWVEKDRGVMMACSSPGDCAELERRHAGDGLLRDGGASRGNLLSGEADHVILTAGRAQVELRANPGYRAFLANGYAVTRSVVLFGWEVALELIAAARAKRRDIRPRGHRGFPYPFMRAGMTILLRDLVVHSVLTDMMAGRPIVYATFASYDEVAHHSGLLRPDTLEALRKLDQQFARIDEARRYAARPYEIVVLSDHGQTQGATFRQRNGYGLDELVMHALEGDRDVVAVEGGDEDSAVVGQALKGVTGGRAGQTGDDEEVDLRAAFDGQDVVVLGSGNLGLISLLEERRRLTLEELGARHPRLVPTLVAHPHIGWVLARSERDGAVVLGAEGRHVLATGEVEGTDPLAPFTPTAAQHLLRTDGFSNCADLMIGSFYDPVTEEGCAFEELISFHGGLGGPQTRPFLLYPRTLPAPDGPLLGAESVHRLLQGWRRHLQGDLAPAPGVAGPLEIQADAEPAPSVA